MMILMVGLQMVYPLIGSLITSLGTLISYEWNIPAGATIALFAGVIYLLALLYKKKVANLSK